MKAGTKQKRTKAAQKAFKKWNENRTPIKIHGTNEFFQAADDEAFNQSPDVKTWFISNKGNIISFNDSENPRLIKPRSDKRERYFSTDGNWMSYELVARAFNSYEFGKAKKDNEEWHHIRAFDSTRGRAFNNDPEFLEGVTKGVHNFLSCIQEHTSEPTIKNMELLSHIAKKEAPGEAVIVTDGGREYTAIFSMSNEEIIEIIKQSPDYEKICNLYQIEKALTNIINMVGYEYFIESKYILFAFPNYTYIYRISNIDDEIIKEDYTNKDIDGIIEPIVVEF